MSLFSRLFPSGGSAAAWAAELRTAKRQAVFVASIERVFHDHGFDVAVDAGVLRSRGAELDGGEVGIADLLNSCAGLPEAEWPARVARHFESIFEVVSMRKALPFDDFEAMRPLLRIHLYPASIRANLVARPLADDLLAALVYDLPNAVTNVPPEQAAAWGRPLGDILDIALDNVRKKEAVSVSPVGTSGALSLLTGGYYTSSHALLLDEQVARPMPYGALVTCPTRQTVIFHVVEDGRALGVLAELLIATSAVHSEGPGPVSSSIYWQRDGVWVRFPLSEVGGQVQLVTPVGFGRVLMEMGVLGPEAQAASRGQ